MGRVTNNTGQRQRFIEINATYYNASGQVIGTGFTFADLDNLAPHASSPFELIEYPEPSSLDHYSLSVSGDSTSEQPSAPMTITPGVPYTDVSGFRHFPGEVTNMSSQPLEFVAVYLTLFGSDGDVVNTDFTFTGPSDIGPWGTAPFEFVLASHHEGGVRFEVSADATTSADGYATTWDNFFSDLGGTGFRTDIIWLATAQVTSGCGGAQFCPAGAVTREQMASFLVRALDLPSTTSDFFTDDETSIHESNINRVAAAGITTGCTATTYCPKAVVTREQMASFLARALDLPSTTSDFFTDDETSVHEVNINRVAAADITSGCTATTYCPTQIVTRGQMAAFLHRAVT